MIENNDLQGKLALFDGPGKAFRLDTQPIRRLEPHEILVRNVYTTICGSDVHTFCGLRDEPCPTVLGHEIVGRIVAISSEHSGRDLRGETLQPGDLVTWTIFSSDPASANSLRGIPQKGDRLFKYGHAKVAPPEVFHGGLAEYCILKPDTGVIRLPENIPVTVAATLNCSVATVAGALRMAGNVRGKNILITGMGHLGVTCAAMCREAGAAWIGAADIAAQRLEEAQGFGVDAVINLAEQPDIAAVTGPRKMDVTFDMSGSPEAMEAGIASLGLGGCAVWIGAVFNTRPLQINAEQVVRNLISIRGLHNYNFEDFGQAFEFLQHHWQQYPFHKSVEKEFPLAEVQAAFEYAVARKPHRVGIRLSY